MKFVVASVAIVAALCINTCQAAGPTQMKDFKDLLTAATKLESAEMLVSNSKLKQDDNLRSTLLYTFAREIKSSHCDTYFETMTKTANEYKIKAYQFVEEETKKNKNWFSFIKFGGPLGAMKGMSKIDSHLGTISERYESQAKNGLLTQLDVDCDMIRFQVRSLHNIMFILQTDIKYLLMEEQQILNKAIYDQLKADKFISGVNFYEIHDLSSKQREILLQYFADRVDDDVTLVGQTVDHYYNPGQYIIGRLLDACQTVQRFEDIWKDRKTNHDEVCSQSTSDPTGHLFAKNYKFNKFDDVFDFCREFLDAL